jgi:myo-inositol-1(or 4)-monophosphatase
MAEFLPLCEEAARAAGTVLRAYAGKIRWREKGKHDLVTEADLAAQEKIFTLLRAAHPDHDLLGEEDHNAIDSASGASQSPFRWVVDPLDGTANYVHGLPNYAVSIALEHWGETVCGVVYDPVADECFAAARGEGATLNGETLRTSDCQSLDTAMIAASFSPNVQRNSPEVARFVEVLHSCQSVRRLGSAALNLCYVGCGRLDGYWATSIKRWDIAAGMLVLLEAGGVITSLEGTPVDLGRPEVVATASVPLHSQLLHILKMGTVPAKLTEG